MKNYIAIRLEKVWISDDMDTFEKGPEGEIQYLAVVATGNRGKEPFAVQKTGFPMENWYEAQDNGVNASFLDGQEKAIPVFCFPENKMGDDLVVSLTVLDNDDASETAIIGHAVAAKAGTAVATIMAGPAIGSLVAGVSGGVQKALEKGKDLDIIGTHTNVLRKSDNFGMPQGEHAITIDATNGNIRIRYTVMRISVLDEQKDWSLDVMLDEVKILEDGDGDTLPFLGDIGKDAGEIYIRARVADGYVGEVFHQTTTHLPESGTKDVYAGHKMPGLPKKLYSNHGKGLPPFLYTEVGVFESDDNPHTPGRCADDVLGVLPLMFTNRWLREHKGRNTFEYTVTGNDPDSEKARIRLTVNVWEPALNVDPDGPLSGN